MIADLKPYAEYKESGLPWLGQVPGHWEVRRLRASITECVNGIWGADPNGRDDLICVRVADFDRVNLRVSLRKKTVRAIPPSVRSRRLLQRGDLLLEKSGGGDLQPVGAVVAFDRDESAVCSNFVARMPLAAGYDSFYVNYLHFALYAYRVNVRSIKQTTGIQNLDGKAYLSEPVAFPPPAEQAAIVRFLDWANGRLERAIRAKRKVIALLGEQKQAIIHRAVTRGLDPSVPLKPSGIPWLGDIPRHWEIVRNMALFTHRVEAGKSELPVLQVSLRSGITAEELDQFGRPKRLIADATKYKLIYKGDVAYNTMRMWQGAVGVSPSDGLVSPAYVVLRPKRDTCPEFYDFIFHTEVYKQEVNRQSTGIVSDRNRLYWDSFKQMPNISLPRDEQEEIVTFILTETSSLNTAISRLEREIELLREYRTRLVADVVTGKLDVREAALRLPDEAPPDTAEDDADLNTDAEATDEEAAV